MWPRASWRERGGEFSPLQALEQAKKSDEMWSHVLLTHICSLWSVLHFSPSLSPSLALPVCYSFSLSLPLLLSLSPPLSLSLSPSLSLSLSVIPASLSLSFCLSLSQVCSAACPPGHTVEQDGSHLSGSGAAGEHEKNKHPPARRGWSPATSMTCLTSDL